MSITDNHFPEPGREPEKPETSETEEEPALFLELAELFFEDTPRQLTALREAVTSGRADLLRHSAHRLKGSALTFGARRMARLCEAIETIGRSGSVAGTKNLLALLEGAFEEVKQRSQSGSQSNSLRQTGVIEDQL